MPEKKGGRKREKREREEREKERRKRERERRERETGSGIHDLHVSGAEVVFGPATCVLIIRPRLQKPPAIAIRSRVNRKKLGLAF